MIKLKRKNVEFADTPLVEGLYVIECGSMLQIRLKESHIVMSAVTSFEELVKCGKLLVERYRTVEYLRKKLSASLYHKLSEQELVRRMPDEEKALSSDLYKRWYEEVTKKPVAETEVKKTKIRKVGIKLKKVATG